MLLNWVQFVVAAFLIIVAGARMTRYADQISDATGIGKGFIGVLLLGMATSLPEMFTSVSASALFDASPMAVGNLLGSCTFNLLIVVGADAFFRIGMARGGTLTAGRWSVLMMVLVLVGYAVGDRLGSFYVHPASVVILAVYLIALWRVFLVDRRYERSIEKQASDDDDSGPAAMPLAPLLAKAALAAVVLVGSSIWISGVSDRLAEQTGLGGTIMGAFFIAIATSLPELAVSVASLRLGQTNLFLGNIFGSNVFNIGIFFMVDLAHGRSGLFDSGLSEHYILALEAMAMTLVLLFGLRRRPSIRLAGMGPDRLAVLVIYIAASLALFYNAFL